MFHHFINQLTDPAAILIDGIVGDPENGQSAAFQVIGPYEVFDLAGRLIVLRTVQLDHETGAVAIKVGNILINDFLPKKADGICA